MNLKQVFFHSFHNLKFASFFLGGVNFCGQLAAKPKIGTEGLNFFVLKDRS